MKSNVIIHRDFSVAEIDPRIYGVHLGVPGGADHVAIQDPTHPASDEDGLRTDVLDLARAFNLPCMFGAAAGASTGKPARLDGDIRVDGLVDWCRRTGAEPMLSLPLVDDAGAGRGIGLGARYGVRMWHFGLEAHQPSAAANLMDKFRAVDPDATLVLGAADTDHALSLFDRHRRAIDLVSLPGVGSASADAAASARTIDRAIDAMTGRLDRSGVSDRCGRAIGLQIDRWGDPTRSASRPDAALERALTMNVLIRRSDRVRTAFAGNVLAGLSDMLSDRIGMGHRSDLYDPLLAGSVYGRGVSLLPAVRGAMVELSDGEAVSAVDAAAVHGRDGSTLTLFLANRAAEAVTVNADLHGFADFSVDEHRVAAPAPRLPGQRAAAPSGERGKLSWLLPARAYAMVRLVRRNG